MTTVTNARICTAWDLTTSAIGMRVAGQVAVRHLRVRSLATTARSKDDAATPRGNRHELDVSSTGR